MDNYHNDWSRASIKAAKDSLKKAKLWRRNYLGYPGSHKNVAYFLNEVAYFRRVAYLTWLGNKERAEGKLQDWAHEAIKKTYEK